MEKEENDLFSSRQNKGGFSPGEPLAARMRPRTMDEFIGQDHIVGRGRLLRRAIQADQLSSLIFYGPPGTGKTTLAKVIANTTRSSFATINAVLAGVKELRKIIEGAKETQNLYDKRTILFIDEVHRWNKAQQDALLPWVENGTVILIGATTENPFFEVNKALVSRSRIFQLTPLTREDLFAVATAALNDPIRGYGSFRVTFEEGALEHVVDVADGDARSLLNALELAVETTPKVFPPPPGSNIHINMETAEESIQKKVVLYDKEGDYHFDTISAFIKSIRGSDPDASLYWLARMVRAGEDPRFIFRRLLILAGEDIGLADPQALVVVEAAAAAFDRVGMPEGRFHLAEATLYCATAKKSNSTLGFFDALETVETESDRSVPDHLKDANRDKEGFGHGEGYLYPHAYRDHWVEQQYLPKGLQGKLFYRPSSQGYENSIQSKVLQQREAQLAISFEDSGDEFLTFTPKDGTREAWLRRTAETKSETLSAVRDRVVNSLGLRRYHRVLVSEPGTGLILWEVLRLTPEGGVWMLAPEERQQEMIRQYSGSLNDIEQPTLLAQSPEQFFTGQTAKKEKLIFDVIAGRNLLLKCRDKAAAIRAMAVMLSEAGGVAVAEELPSRATRLSAFLLHKIPDSTMEKLTQAEESVYSNPEDPRTNWTPDQLRSYFEEVGFTNITVEEENFEEERYISEDDLHSWFAANGKTEGYGTVLSRFLEAEELNTIEKNLLTEVGNSTVCWKKTVLFISGFRTLR
jgi:putative ATPase